MNLFELNFSVGCVVPFRDLDGRMGLFELIYCIGCVALF